MIEEGILNQLGYSVTPNLLEQIRKTIANTKGFEQIERHLIALNDKLKNYLGFVGLSGSKYCFKIKNTSPDVEVRKMVEDTIKSWAQKYKIAIEKVPNKETYYILGCLA